MTTKLKKSAIALAAFALFSSALHAGTWTLTPTTGDSATIEHSDGNWVLTVTVSGTADLTINRYSAGTGHLPLNDAVTDLSGNTYTITTIRVNAFNACLGLTSLTLPDSVTHIGMEAFNQCISLTGDLIIPGSVTNLDTKAFSGCYSLTSVTIESGLTHIGWSAFMACYSLTNVIIPDSVISLEGRTFGECGRLTSVTLPDSILYIGVDTFSVCTNLTNILIPNSVTNIDMMAFLLCTALTNLTIPASVTRIGDGAFVGCSSLTSVIFEGEHPDTLFDEYTMWPEEYRMGLFGHDPYGFWAGSPDLSIDIQSPFVTNYIYAAHLANWELYLDSGSFGLDNAMWQGRPIRLLVQPSPAEMNVHVDHIDVDTTTGNVTLIWNHAQLDALFTGGPGTYHYEIRTSTDLNLTTWDILTTLQFNPIARAAGNEGAIIPATTTPIPDKRFFKVKAIGN